MEECAVVRSVGSREPKEVDEPYTAGPRTEVSYSDARHACWCIPMQTRTTRQPVPVNATLKPVNFMIGARPESRRFGE